MEILLDGKKVANKINEENRPIYVECDPYGINPSIIYFIPIPIIGDSYNAFWILNL